MKPDVIASHTIGTELSSRFVEISGGEKCATSALSMQPPFFQVVRTINFFNFFSSIFSFQVFRFVCFWSDNEEVGSARILMHLDANRHGSVLQTMFAAVPSTRVPLLSGIANTRMVAP